MPDVVLPVLDEADAIPRVLARLPRGYEPIVVDNGSTDGSATVALNLGARVVVEPSRGFGAVCFMAWRGCLPPAELPLAAALARAGRADPARGARQPTHADAWPRHARIANRALTRLVEKRVGGRVHDLGPMRAARREPLLDLR